ncbi:MAG: BMP family ABC transporter substrate-binding protein [Anaerolineae bacterium]|nr:BMP family ABC transporter substrate-binding protein [Anaerolineae bacterium]
MKLNVRRSLLLGVVALALALSAIGAPSVSQAQDKFVVGFVLVGPQLDKGWNQAHLEASEYLKEKIPGVDTIILDKLNPADRPNVTLEQVVDNMVSEGAKMIFTTSDDFGADTVKVAAKYPDIPFVHVSGDAVLKGNAPKNLANVMGKMEYMKMIAGCAAAIKTETGRIAYLGPIIQDETRRLTSAAYLGAKYCWTELRKEDPAKLTYEVKWIGFWFNIPGVTLDPTEVANSMFDAGADVILSGIDTPEATTVAVQRREKGEKTWVIPYDYREACELAVAGDTNICLGVPYFNWGPSYVALVKSVQDGKFESKWDWTAPNWADLNNPDTSNVGFVYGPSLNDDNKAMLDKFVAGLADGSINLYKGPINFQDGTVYLKDGETATDEQIWYLPQLLEGMTGASKAETN